MLHAIIAAVVLCGCGRIGFEAIGGDGSLGDGSTAAFCATRTPAPTFCDDFDEGRGTSMWLGQATANGTFAIDSNAGLSRPAALALTVNARLRRAAVRARAAGA